MPFKTTREAIWPNPESAARKVRHTRDTIQRAVDALVRYANHIRGAQARALGRPPHSRRDPAARARAGGPALALGESAILKVLIFIWT